MKHFQVKALFIIGLQAGAEATPILTNSGSPASGNLPFGFATGNEAASPLTTPGLQILGNYPSVFAQALVKPHKLVTRSLVGDIFSGIASKIWPAGSETSPDHADEPPQEATAEVYASDMPENPTASEGLDTEEGITNPEDTSDMFRPSGPDVVVDLMDRESMLNPQANIAALKDLGITGIEGIDSNYIPETGGDSSADPITSEPGEFWDPVFPTVTFEEVDAVGMQGWSKSLPETYRMYMYKRHIQAREQREEAEAAGRPTPPSNLPPVSLREYRLDWINGVFIDVGPSTAHYLQPVPKPWSSIAWIESYEMRKALEDILRQGEMTQMNAKAILRVLEPESKAGMQALLEKHWPNNKEHPVKLSDIDMARGAIGGLAVKPTRMHASILMDKPWMLECAALAATPEFLNAAGITIGATHAAVASTPEFLEGVPSFFHSVAAFGSLVPVDYPSMIPTEVFFNAEERADYIYDQRMKNLIEAAHLTAIVGIDAINDLLTIPAEAKNFANKMREIIGWSVGGSVSLGASGLLFGLLGRFGLLGNHHDDSKKETLKIVTSIITMSKSKMHHTASVTQTSGNFSSKTAIITQIASPSNRISAGSTSSSSSFELPVFSASITSGSLEPAVSLNASGPVVSMITRKPMMSWKPTSVNESPLPTSFVTVARVWPNGTLVPDKFVPHVWEDTGNGIPVNMSNLEASGQNSSPQIDIPVSLNGTVWSNTTAGPLANITKPAWRNSTAWSSFPLWSNGTLLANNTETSRVNLTETGTPLSISVPEINVQNANTWVGLTTWSDDTVLKNATNDLQKEPLNWLNTTVAWNVARMWALFIGLSLISDLLRLSNATTA